MEPFVTLTGVAAPLLRANIDTDLIIPKQFLKTLVRSGLGQHLFSEVRYDAEGRERLDFILNQAPYRAASILLAGPNFGCGSSREHAPWALKDFGIRAVLAPSCADIFSTNCDQTGLLPVGPARFRPPAALPVPVAVDELLPLGVGHRHPADAEGGDIDGVGGTFVVQRERFRRGVDPENELTGWDQHRRPGHSGAPRR